MRIGERLEVAESSVLRDNDLRNLVKNSVEEIV